MTDIAALGFSVDSSAAVKSASDLDKLTESSVRVEQATNRANSAFDKQAESARGLEKSSRSAAEASKKISEEVSKTSAAAERASTGMGNLSTNAEKVAQASSRAVDSLKNTAQAVSDTSNATAKAVETMGLYLDRSGKLRDSTGRWASAQSTAQAVAAAMNGTLDEQSLAALKAVGALNEAAVAAGEAANKFAEVMGGVRSLSEPFEQASAAYSELNTALSRGVIHEGEFASSVEKIRKAFEESGGSAESWGVIVKQSADQASNSISGVEQALSLAKRAMGALGIALGGRQLVSYADQWSDMQSRVGAAIRDMEAAPEMMERLVSIANQSYSSIGQTVEVYARNVSVLAALGGTADDAATYTEALNNALVITATRGQRAASVQDALSKAMAVGKLQADGLETVLANGGAVAEALADELGTTVNGLRQFATEGKITSAVIANSLIKRADEFAERVGEMPSTIQDAFLRLNNNFLAFIGTMDNATGASAMVSDAIMLVANNLDFIVKAATTAGITLGVAFSGEILRSVLSLAVAIETRLVTAINLVTAAAVRNPFGALVVGATAAITALTLFRDEIVLFEDSQVTLGDVMRATWSEMGPMVENASAAIGQAGQSAFTSWWTHAQNIGSMIDELLGNVFSGWYTHFESTRALIQSWVDWWYEGSSSVAGNNEEASVATHGYWATAMSETRKEIATLIGAGFAAKEGFMHAWDNFPDLLKSVAVIAVNAFIGVIEWGLNMAMVPLNSMMAGINALRMQMGAEPIRLFDPIELTYLENEAPMALENLGDAMKRGFQQGYDGAMESMNGFTSRVTATATASRTELEKMNATNLQPLSGNLRDVASNAEETAKKLKEAESAAKALANEANSAIQRFFPLEHATAEAERLNAAINDTTNGLSDLQREALRMQMGQNFTDAASAADKLAQKTDKASKDMGQSFKENVGDIVSEIFLGDNVDNFAERAIKAFAKIGSQLATVGLDKLVGNIFGTGPSTTGTGNLSGLVFGANRQPVANDNQIVRNLNSSMSTTGQNVLSLAKSFDGLNEKTDRQIINGFLANSGTVQLDAATQAWCAAFANAALMKNGIAGTGSNMASSFMDWGMGTNNPKPGDIVVLKPGQGGGSGHVTFFQGFDQKGNILGFGGNQSNNAQTSSYNPSQVRAFRTYGEQREFSNAVATGTADGTKSALGSINMGGSADGAGLLSPKAQQGLGLLAGGFGAFSQGYESGSPLSGGVGGALSGYGMAPQISSFLGVGAGAGMALGVVGGAALGILGGIFGARQRRKQEHKNRAAEWAQMQPEYNAFKDSLSGYGPTFGIADEQTRLRSEMDKFVTTGSAAWKYGTGNSSAEFNSTARMIADYTERMKAGFRDIFEPTIRDLTSGRGLNGAFTQARDSIRKVGEEMDTFISDTSEAFGKNSDQVNQAKEAVVSYYSQVITGGKELTTVEKALDSMNGAAAGVRDAMNRLGVEAERTAAIIDTQLVEGFNKIRNTFIEGISGDIEANSGRGYMSELRTILKQFEEYTSDARLLGVDQAMIDQWLKTSAQSVVDATDLTGDALEDLIRAFPQLNGVITTSMQVLERSVSEAEANLRAAYNKQKATLEQSVTRLESFIEAIGNFNKSLDMNANLSDLGPYERFLKAQEEFRDISEKALAGDAEAQEKLTSVSQSYLEEARSYYASSEAYYAAFNEVKQTMSAAEALAKQQLDSTQKELEELDKVVGALIDIDTSVMNVEQAIREFNEAQAARDNAQAVYLTTLTQAINTPAPVEYQPPAATSPSGGGANGNQSAAAKSYANYYDGNGYARYEGEYQIVNGARILVPTGMSTSRAWMLYVQTQQYKNRNDMPGGRQAGGMITDGVYNQDSVAARTVSGQNYSLAGGEYIVTASGVNPSTYSTIDYINRNHRPPPSAAVDLAPVVTALRELRQDNAQLSQELRALRQVTAQGAMTVAGEVKAGARENSRNSLASRREVYNRGSK